MQEHYVRPEGLPPANGYSHAVAFSGRMVAVSGQVPLDGQGRIVGQDDPYAQARQVFEMMSVSAAQYTIRFEPPGAAARSGNDEVAATRARR